MIKVGANKSDKTGKYHDWIEGEGLQKICQWIRYGLGDEQIAKNMGIGRTSFYNWQKKFPEFAKAIKEARINPNIEIENSMFELACGKAYVEETKTILDPTTGTILKVEKVRKQVPPSPAMLIFLAKNRIRDKYRDYAPVPYETDTTEEKQEVEIYLPDNGRGGK